jgi:hypothetical protein
MFCVAGQRKKHDMPPEVIVYLVESSPDINGGRLDDVINHIRQRSQEIARIDLGVEEDFRGQEALVSDINADLASAKLLNHELLEPLRFTVKPGELLHDIRANVTEGLLDLFGSLERRIRLATVSQERLNEVGDISSGDGNRLDGGPNDVTFGLSKALASRAVEVRFFGAYHRDDMGDTITGIDDSTCQAPVLDLVASPTRSKCEDSLHGDVETGTVERLEHNLGRVLARLWRIKGLERN